MAIAARVIIENNKNIIFFIGLVFGPWYQRNFSREFFWQKPAKKYRYSSRKTHKKNRHPQDTCFCVRDRCVLRRFQTHLAPRSQRPECQRCLFLAEDLFSRKGVFFLRHLFTYYGRYRFFDVFSWVIWFKTVLFTPSISYVSLSLFVIL